jgi:hypothetical protein
VISIDSPTSGDHWWTVEISSPVTSTFQMGIQLVRPGLVVDETVTEGLVPPGLPLLYLFQLQASGENVEIIRLVESEP